MHAVLALEHTEGELAIHFHGGLFDARAFTVLVVERAGLVAVLLGPHLVHAQQHAGPIAALRATGPCGDLHHGAQRILFGTEHVLELKLFQRVAGLLELDVHLLLAHILRLPELEHHAEVVHLTFHGLVQAHPPL